MTTLTEKPKIYGKIKIRTSQLQPNPYQPLGRIEISEETASMLGQSILETGIILTPVARPGKYSPGEEPYYEMGDGWLRLAGIRWIEIQGHETYRDIAGENCCSDQIIVNLCDLTDQQMADMVMEANLKRKDLNPIEQAELFSRYTKDFGISQAKLAADHNITQGEVSNTIRLLELPAEIQAMVSNGEISQTHARQLLRLKDDPATQKALRAAKMFCMPETRRHHFLTLAGPPGVGKTHLAQAIGWQWAEELKFAFRYVQAERMMDGLRRCFDSRSTGPEDNFDTQLNLLCKIPLLILDDLGTESTSDWSRAKIQSIIDERYENGRLTVFTLNGEPGMLGARIASRLREGVVVVMDAQDYRQVLAERRR
ncbi:MAG: ParB/RepB/Spo0J family partition protein [Dehalogenimonas sp.]|nr:ParB/RepB/Spo0J family partition protein [Dehalogenimonas sp.]